MRVLVLTDDLVGPEMAGSALRAWELARVLLGAGHEVVLSAGTDRRGVGPMSCWRPRGACRPAHSSDNIS